MSDQANYHPIWDEIYETKTAPMKYPHESVIRFVMIYHPRTKPRSESRILEVGCGMGNNLWYCAREGFQVVGMDAAPLAIEYARERFAEEGLAGEFHVARFGELPFPDASFDLVIDQGGLTCAGRGVAAEAIREIRRVLTPAGKFLFTPFSKTDTSAHSGEPGPDDTVVNIRAGTVLGRGHICFYDRADLENTMGKGWKVLAAEHHQMVDEATPDRTQRSTWRVIAEKTEA